MAELGYVDETYVDAMQEREKLVTTYMGMGVAIPHGTSQATKRLRRQVSYSCSILKVWISVMRRQNLYLVLPESVMNIWNFYPRSVRFWKMKKFLRK